MKCNETIIVFFITYCSYCILCKLAKVFLCKSYSLYQTEKRFSLEQSYIISVKSTR